MDGFTVQGGIAEESKMFSSVTSKLYALPNDWFRMIFTGMLYSPIIGMYTVLSAIKEDKFLRFALTGLMKLYSLKHTGLTHYGLGESIMSTIDCFTCKSKLQQTYKGYFGILADIIFYMEKGYPASCNIYTPNGFMYYRLTGLLLAIFSTLLGCTGALQQEAMKVLRINSTLRTTTEFYYRAASNLRVYMEERFDAIGNLTVPLDIYLKAKGFCLENFKKAYAAASSCIPAYYGMILARAGIGFKFRKPVKVSGRIQKTMNIVRKVKGKLKNRRGDWFLKMNGTIELIAKAFAFAVPKRNQQFWTNKKWFRKTNAKKGK